MTLKQCFILRFGLVIRGTSVFYSWCCESKCDIITDEEDKEQLNKEQRDLNRVQHDTSLRPHVLGLGFHTYDTLRSEQCVFSQEPSGCTFRAILTTNLSVSL